MSTALVGTKENPRDEGITSLAAREQFLAYGEFVFPAGTMIDFTEETVYDSSGRDAHALKLTIEAKFLVTAGAELLGIEFTNEPGGFEDLLPDRNRAAISSDAEINRVLAYLRSPRRALRLRGIGYGNWEIHPTITDIDARRTPVTNRPIRDPSDGTDNSQNVRYDIKNGPKPHVSGAAVLNLGASAKMVTWSVSCVIPFCERGSDLSQLRSALRNGPESLNYRVVTAEEGGYITRTIVGTLRAYQVGNDELDEHRSALERWFPKLDRFRRNFPQVEVSEDRTELRFTIVDREIGSDNPYEVGVEMELRYEVSSNLSSAFQTWTCSLGGTIRVLPHYPKVWGYFAFLRVYVDLINRNLEGSFPGKNSPEFVGGLVSAGQPGIASVSFDDASGIPRVRLREPANYEKVDRTPYVQLNAVTFAEERFSRVLDIEVSWNVYAVDLQGILLASGYAQPGRTGATWENWRNSTDAVVTPDGFQSLDNPVDYRIDLCDPDAVAPPAQTNHETDEYASSEFQRDNQSPSGSENNTNDTGSPDTEDVQNETLNRSPFAAGQDGEGYIAFENKVTIISRGQNSTAHPLDYFPDGDEFEVRQNLVNDGGADAKFLASKLEKHRRQEPVSAAALRRGRVKVRKPAEAQYYAVMRGYAIRASKKPRVPVLTYVGAMRATPTQDDEVTFQTHDGRSALGEVQPSHSVKWIKIYRLEGRPIDDVMQTDFNPMGRHS